MKRVRHITCASAACCFVISALDTAESQPIESAEAGWAAITKCAGIADDDSRHACVDEVLRDAGLMPTDEAKSSERRKRFGLQRSAARAASSDQASEQVEVTLAAVEESGDGKLVLTTTEGAVWRQVESEAVRPMPVQGQTMTIAKASLGGFLCKSGKWTAFRCYRAR